MTVFAFERERESKGPEHDIKHLVKRIAQKIENEARIPYELLENLDELNEKLVEKKHPQVSK